MKMKWIIGVLKQAYVQKVIGEGVAYVAYAPLMIYYTGKVTRINK